jgi:hypothetical protein
VAACAPLASWSAPGGLTELVVQVREAHEHVREVLLGHGAAEHGCRGLRDRRGDRAVDDAPSGAVWTWIVAFSGVFPGAVEVAAAEKFSGIVITAS